MFFIFALAAQAQIVKRSTEDLFALRDRDNRGKTPAQIHRESIAQYDAFVALDMNTRQHSPVWWQADAHKPTRITRAQANRTMRAAEQNPVVALYAYSKYDPQDSGIGFCFGRAMFVDLYLAMNGVNRSNIKKAFIIGPMSNGGWAWHVTTIVESRDNRGNEIWLAIDPVAERVMEVKEWYNYWYNSASDDKRLRLYITESGKFGAGRNSRYDELSIASNFYNNYFTDMMAWFANNDITNELGLNVNRPRR
jgi:hypothetical protein